MARAPDTDPSLRDTARVLTFDERPAASDLAVLLGPDAAAGSVQWDEDRTRVSIGPPRVPFRPVLAFLATFFGALTAAPWVLPQLGVGRPAHLTDELVLGLTVATWCLVLPAVLGILWLIDRRAAQLGPGAIVDKRTLDLTLPWIDHTVPADRIEGFVELIGRHRSHGRTSTLGQYGVLFRDDDGRFVFAPVARLTTVLHGRTALDRLAELYGRRVQKVRAGVFAMR